MGTLPAPPTGPLLRTPHTLVSWAVWSCQPPSPATLCGTPAREFLTGTPPPNLSPPTPLPGLSPPPPSPSAPCPLLPGLRPPSAWPESPHPDGFPSASPRGQLQAPRPPGSCLAAPVAAPQPGLWCTRPLPGGRPHLSLHACDAHGDSRRPVPSPVSPAPGGLRGSPACCC